MKKISFLKIIASKIPFHNQLILGIFIAVFLFQNNLSKAADTLVIHSKYIPVSDSILIFTPQNYNSHDSIYPAVFLLHGYGGNYKSFSRFLDLQALANQYNFIIICPDGLKESWYLNSPVKPSFQYESFFFNDLWTNINTTYRIDTMNIFITGFSMGGHGAMYLFLRNQNKFRAAGSSSGVLDLNYSSLKLTSISKLLGDYGIHPQAFDKFSAINHLDSIKFTDKQIFVDCGTKDHLLEANKLFNEACMERWIMIRYMTMEGRHNKEYWEKSFPWHFYFFSQQVKR